MLREMIVRFAIGRDECGHRMKYEWEERRLGRRGPLGAREQFG